ncbi:hypothetical protein [Rhodovulum adriaticum]|uniref:Uncharacterized protein n=1 Tax=Rhodovulum adriaticum TaxID=35804 RepID=A0A4R2NYJ9_RHOAD|nr:hypothetical protein [Rhodovulum adriaticum]MBK1634255.1 hypothetical protein [Rhodovulum adriaticum]TCP27192.1 hypothetical protein EV656_10195 [Rhodovulum adriaticum]
MEPSKVMDYARALFEAHGDKAEAEAAQKAATLEAQGEAAQADTWRKVQAAIKEMRAPHQG